MANRGISWTGISWADGTATFGRTQACPGGMSGTGHFRDGGISGTGHFRDGGISGTDGTTPIKTGILWSGDFVV
jgi:hypothetical protein